MCLYRVSPHCFLIVLPDAVFFEQYHYGRSGDERKGGLLPTLQMEENQKLESIYQQLEGHFEYVWLSGRLVTKSAANDFNNKMIEDLKLSGRLNDICESQTEECKTKQTENNQNKSNENVESKT